MADVGTPLDLMSACLPKSDLIPITYPKCTLYCKPWNIFHIKKLSAYLATYYRQPWLRTSCGLDNFCPFALTPDKSLRVLQPYPSPQFQWAYWNYTFHPHLGSSLSPSLLISILCYIIIISLKPTTILISIVTLPLQSWPLVFILFFLITTPAAFKANASQLTVAGCDLVSGPCWP